MNTAVAVAGIASRTIEVLAGLWAFVRVAPAFLPRLGIANRAQRSTAAEQPAGQAGNP